MPNLKTLAAAAVLALSAALPAAADVLQEILDRGVFRVGMAESPPWQAPNPDSGAYEGVNVDLAARVAEVMGVELEIVPASWATLIPGLEAEQYDAIFANLFATPPRAMVVNFTDPYSTYGFHVVVRADSPITTLDQLNDPGVTFVGMSGTVEETYPREVFPQANVRGIATNDVAAWITEVAMGQADAAFLDPGTMKILVTQNPALGERLRTLNGEDALLKPVGLSYALRPDDLHMLNFLNTFIADQVRNGEVVRLRDAWFETVAKRN